MKRADFKQIIKLRSNWKIDRRKGGYKLPNGKKLSDYVEQLIKTQLELDSLGILENGEIAFWNKVTGELMPAYADNESTTEETQQKRIKILAKEITG